MLHELFSLIYYFTLLFITISTEINTIKNPSLFVKINADNLDDIPSDIKVLHIMYSLLVFLGVFTSQWPIFLVLISLSLISQVSFLQKKTFIRIDSAICIAITAFIVINRYHLHLAYY